VIILGALLACGALAIIAVFLSSRALRANETLGSYVGCRRRTASFWRVDYDGSPMDIRLVVDIGDSAESYRFRPDPSPALELPAQGDEIPDSDQSPMDAGTGTFMIARMTGDSL
jgi:hypothetical protein